MRITPLLFALALPSITFAQTPLAWKFQQGDTLTYERIAKDSQATIIKGQTLKQEVLQTWVYRFETLKTEGDAATVQITIEKVSVQHTAGPGQIENKVLEKLKGAKFTAAVSRRGEIGALTGYEQALELMSEKREATAKALRQNVPEAAFRAEFQQTLAILPKDAIAPGTRWQHEGEILPLPPFGRFLATMNGVLANIDRAGHHHLTGTLTGKFERPDPASEFFRIVGGNLTFDKGQWSCIFDNDRGRVLSQQLTLEMKGELTVEIVGATTPVEIAIRREVKTRLLPK